MVVALAVLVLAPAARADWMPGDGHKMHYPQLPDPNGWDVAFYSDWYPPCPGPGPCIGPGIICDELADDWKCDGTGAVEDIHFWVSMNGDHNEPEPVPFTITSFRATIYGNIPADPADPNPYSRPDRNDLKWERMFGEDEIQVRHWDSSPQAWFEPATNEVIEGDHEHIYQVNIEKIDNAFVQQDGTIYWLEIASVEAVDIAGGEVDLGWKTAVLQGNPPRNFMDDAVYHYYDDMHTIDHPEEPPISRYEPLELGGHSRDFAFVITPEPATLALLGLGAGALLARRRRRK